MDADTDADGDNRFNYAFIYSQTSILIPLKNPNNTNNNTNNNINTNNNNNKRYIIIQFINDLLYTYRLHTQRYYSLKMFWEKITHICLTIIIMRMWILMWM